jgi:hypothetical protein
VERAAKLGLGLELELELELGLGLGLGGGLTALERQLGRPRRQNALRQSVRS